MRRLEPFAYFNDHASAIRGFGGAEQAPDPRYCFHTRYEEVRPGRIVYRLHLTRVRASQGELTLRVHAYKPSSNSDVILVGGAKLLFDEAMSDDGEDIELPVRFTAVKGVNYALYGFFSEPSDLKVDNIMVTLDEQEPSEDLRDDPRPKSPFAVGDVATQGRLYADAPPSLGTPVSQDCTIGQLAPALSGAGDALEQWRAGIALAALERYGMLKPGATGVVAAPLPEGVTEALEAQGCQLTAWDGFGPDDLPDAAYDFVLSYALDAPFPGADQRRQIISDTMSALMGGGIAVFVLRYHAAAPGLPCRNEIEQWALRLIGLGHDVAQLAFAPARQRVIQADGSTPFVLIVRSG
jgi:hypothetical protein